MITLSLFILIGLSSPLLSNPLVKSLESKYPILLSAPEDTALILVLANSQAWADERPSNTAMLAVGLSRITEGVRLWKTRPSAMLATSSKKLDGQADQTTTMLQFAIEKGVSPEHTVQFPGTRDTSDEIKAVMDYMKHHLSDKGQRLVVVSSALHLARAEVMLQEYEVLYTMAPTDFLAIHAPWHRLSGQFLENANRAMHEYIGIAWLHLQSVFKRP